MTPVLSHSVPPRPVHQRRRHPGPGAFPRLGGEDRGRRGGPRRGGSSDTVRRRTKDHCRRRKGLRPEIGQGQRRRRLMRSRRSYTAPRSALRGLQSVRLDVVFCIPVLYVGFGVQRKHALTCTYIWKSKVYSMDNTIIFKYTIQLKSFFV